MTSMFHTRMLARALVVAASTLTLAACAVGPVYHPPIEAPVAVTDADPALVSAQPVEPAWWRSFGDPELDSLIQRALAGNLDLKQSIARVSQARALFTDSKLDLFPRVTSDAGYARSDEQQPGFGTARENIEQADLGFDAAWEIDLFGRVRHGVDSAKAQAQASREDLRDVKVTVVAEVARNYLELRGAQARRAVAQANADTQRETLRLTSVRRGIGYGDPVDVESAKARLAATQASIPPLITDEKRAAERLAVLTGQRPGALDAELAPTVVVASVRATPLPIGDVTALLRNRPDVRAAERRLAAETAQTGVATADLFPRVRVTGFIGLLSGDVSSLFKSGAEAWSVSPSVTWPAFDLGGAQARLRAQKARGDESLAAYQQTALRAIEDLQDAITTYRQRQAQVASLAEQVAAARRASDLARARFKEGDIDFLRVLDADRTRLEAEDSLTQAQTAANTDVVAIYKALGGDAGA
jgi:multidrug efflux system outer membrane protein